MNVFLFHRDLRIVDNTALLRAPQPVTPLFVFPTDQIDSKKNKYFSHAAVQFMCESLVDLNTSIMKASDSQSRLHMCQATSTVAALTSIHADTPIATLTQNKDFSVYAKERDAAIAKWCVYHKVTFNNDAEDYDLVAANELRLADTKPYTVLAAYYNRFIKENLVREPFTKKLVHGWFARAPSAAHLPHEIPVQHLQTFYTHNDILAQRGGRTEALKAIKRLHTLKASYDHDRNYPALPGTTMLSAHLKFGTLSVRELFAALAKPEAFGRADNPLTRELVFRSFYIKICSSRPGLQRAMSFRQDIDVHIPWKRHGDPEYARLWKAWTEGTTGFPLADAGMRQLNATGYMHGRVRMVAATVLTRYFLIDWRDGARYFAQHLVDYDPCSNNMGWQFSSALGENTQNVYRAPMNPFLQSKNYDAECVYIKRYIPELADATPKQIHTGSWPDTLQYPKPIIDQKEASRHAVATWKNAISHTKED